MAVNWNWNRKIGYIIYNQNGEKFVVNIYEGNCLGALIYEYKDQETKKNMYQFFGFWNDEQHLKNCLGLSKGYKDNMYKSNGVISIMLNTYYKDSLKIASLFARSGINTGFYLKEPKK